MGEFYLSRSSKAQFGYNRTKITGTSHKDLRTFIYVTTLVKSVTKTESIWLPWLPFVNKITIVPWFLLFVNGPKVVRYADTSYIVEL